MVATQREEGAEEAEAACEELREALRGSGVTLPSLAPDPAPESALVRVSLVDLGRCNPATARALASAVRAGAGARKANGAR